MTLLFRPNGRYAVGIRSLYVLRCWDITGTEGCLNITLRDVLETFVCERTDKKQVNLRRKDSSTSC